MPLSEEELRLLEQMERALVEEDPKFASTLRGTSFKQAARRRAILAGVVFVIGIAVLMSGAVFRMIPVGVIGFVIMLVSATYGLSTVRGRAKPVQEGDVKETRHHGLGVVDGGRVHRPKMRRSTSSAPFMERLEERWRNRRDNGGF
ncbi:DUF3040 domain-containing protein [Nocardioides sp. JQ2195]|uniref:DUF3040 domain-containing protein n=1 Tax=Nocardioides sp. JQ2195 TaxID=2592334 RepID=UPI00143E5C5D|nr:DUF3040 domain-containing protein [Nocardioides sp. JQ2195]QIX26352.1 DUF3040 domain-containing protein [Nocardioides sp. JQ2195]